MQGSGQPRNSLSSPLAVRAPRLYRCMESNIRVGSGFRKAVLFGVRTTADAALWDAALWELVSTGRLASVLGCPFWNYQVSRIIKSVL